MWFFAGKIYIQAQMYAMSSCHYWKSRSICICIYKRASVNVLHVQYCTSATCVRSSVGVYLFARTISGYRNYLKMLSRQFAQLRITTRCFTRSSIIREINKDKIPAEKIVNDTTGVIGSRMHRVSDFDRRMLVWVKRYPSIADVPKDVTVECILHARNKARIKTGNYLIGFTILGCIGAVILGKRDAARGENLVKQREDWLRERFAEDKKK